MKVLLLSNVFPPGFIGGYELGALEIASHLAGSGHEVNVLTSDYFQDEQKLITGFPVDRILECCELSHERPTPPSSELEGVFCNWRNLRRIARSIRRDVPDLVISFNLSGLGQVAIYQFLAGCNIARLSYFMDSCFQSIAQLAGPWKEYQRIFGPLRGCDLGRVIVMSRNLLGELSGAVEGLCPANVAFVPGWVDPTLATPCTMKPLDRRRPLRRFVFCGRVAPHKGIDLTLAACENLVKSGRGDFIVDVYGAGQVTYLLQEVCRRELSKVINYEGVLTKEEMIGRFGGYDAMLFPTWEREPFGFTVSEAAAAGCISIMTSSIGAAEWFFDGVDCLKISRSVSSLEKAMLQILETRPETLERMKNAARTNARVNLNVNRWGRVIESECTGAAASNPLVRSKTVSQIEAAFLVMSDLWRSQLDRQ